MAFEARALRVQLPCGQITVVEAEKVNAELRARRVLRNMFSPVADDDCEGPPTREPECPGKSDPTDCVGGRSGADILDHLCKGSDPLDFRVLVDASILPELRRQLEVKLKEIDDALAALANTPQPNQ